MHKTDTIPFARVLSISPSRDHRHRDREMLASAGASEIYSMDSVKEGLAWLAANPVDLLLLDADLGRTTGPRVLRILRRKRSLRRLPVIVTAADGGRETVLDAVAAGCSGFLLRPYSMQTLLRQCRLAAAGANPGRERLEALRQARREARQGRHQRAVRTLDRVVARREEAERLYAEGCEHLADGRFEQAIAAFGKAVAMNDLFAEAYIGMANAWEALGHPDKARACMRRAAEAYARASEMERARGILAQTLRDMPSSGNPFLDLGFSLVRSGEFRAAGKAYVLASRHGGTGEASFKAAARACLFTADPRRAARLLSEAVAEAHGGLHAYTVYKRIMGDVPRADAGATGVGRGGEPMRAVNDVWAVVKYTAKAFLGGGPPPCEPLPLDF